MFYIVSDARRINDSGSLHKQNLGKLMKGY